MGAGRAYAADANAVVYGDTALVFDGVIPSQDLYAGGYANAAANVAVTGTATLEMRNLASEFSKFIYGGGFADASGAASDVGAAAVKLSGDQNMKGWIFGGGKQKTMQRQAPAYWDPFPSRSGIAAFRALIYSAEDGETERDMWKRPEKQRST